MTDSMTQMTMFTDHVQEVKGPDINDIRNRLSNLLSAMKNSDASPWSARETKKWLTVFPQMCQWLPQKEEQSFLSQFQVEKQRLGLIS